jgi:hypothetical protein
MLGGVACAIFTALVDSTLGVAHLFSAEKEESSRSDLRAIHLYTLCQLVWKIMHLYQSARSHHLPFSYAFYEQKLLIDIYHVMAFSAKTE